MGRGPGEDVVGIPELAIGLAEEEAGRRLVRSGRNEVRGDGAERWLMRQLWQLWSPLNVLLISAAGISLFLQEWPDAVIVLSVLGGSALLSGVQEYLAGDAARRLQSRLLVRAVVLRGGVEVRLPMGELVPGDVVKLSAGSLVPADGVVVAADDLYVSEAALTGEVFPVEKRAIVGERLRGELSKSFWADLSVDERVLMGTNVRSGYGVAVIVRTGSRTAPAAAGAATRPRRRCAPTCGGCPWA